MFEADDQNLKLNTELDVPMFDAFDASKYDLSTQDQAAKEQIVKDFKKQVQTMNLPKDKARSILLGEQWFMGRTGFEALSPTLNN